MDRCANVEVPDTETLPANRLVPEVDVDTSALADAGPATVRELAMLDAE